MTIDHGGSLLHLFQQWRPNTFAARRRIKAQIGDRAVHAGLVLKALGGEKHAGSYNRGVGIFPTQPA
eukprot:CAMPEP_0172567482 /NCGR_PEP_ID=MMETSP1067-20121228/116028_1 /TAXON_ID=265564 ORGANISM="Thalassiosira punctigera, Strain Tpunct2005C2" /NCGR_SAMPLE_ID=MMETSP1067 /ASSEMBLY_ACC=CAM_ASM_000444 /LENGTH=66 /DNA_ID=CAMNT_0013358845 /DNA_START=342 /DNA_END=538 /DNA_ORIENTATION=-